MSKQTINLGAIANDQTGDALRVGGQKINENFDEVYSMLTEGNLGSFSQIIGQADRLPYFTGVGALSVTTLNALGRSIIGAVNQLAARQALGLGTSSTYDRGAANGVASLGADGKLIPSQTPDMSINDVYPVNSQAAMLALPADQGDIAIRTDEMNKPYILGALPASTLANWYPIGQSLSAALSAISGLTPAADTIPYYTGANTAALATFNALGRSLVGAASQAAARAALALGNASLAGILGTVSHSGGIPTGDIFQVGSNSNGKYIKYASGEMICYGVTGSVLANITTASGIMFFTSLSGAFPVSFLSGTTPVVLANFTAAGRLMWSNLNADPPSNSYSIYVMATSSMSVTGTLEYVAIGRWF